MTCQGCCGELTPMEAAMAAGDGYGICMGCVKARARAVQTHKCSCGKKRRPTDVLGHPKGRRWIACRRCLGTIRQVA